MPWNLQEGGDDREQALSRATANNTRAERADT
jgi:hypothetical protein